METLRITVRAKPGSSRTHVGGSYGDDRQLVVAVSAQAVDGKANDAVIAALAKALDVPRRDLTLVAGVTARTKVFELAAADVLVMRQRIEQLLGSH